MDFLWTIFFALVAGLWLVKGLRALGMLKLPRIDEVEPLPPCESVTVSILFAARDEATKLPGALPTLLEQDYARFEVIAVDDRSVDGTAQILEQFAREHPELKVIHISQLPAGWLGKPHALQTAYSHCSGEWIVFTDADVRFARDLLGRALALVRNEQWDHLTLIGLLDMKGFWEKAVLSFFAFGFTLATEPWNVSKPGSRRYLGTGYFQLIRRSVYERIGTHQRLALEVVDDLKLGKLVKQAGFRSGVGFADRRLSVRWQEGLKNIVRGTTKNFFAATGFRWEIAALQVLGLIILDVLPFFGLVWARGGPQLFAGAAAAALLVLHGATAYTMRISPLYAITHPLGALLFAYLILNSTIVTLRQGGVTWRGTFYPLEQLRRGLV